MPLEISRWQHIADQVNAERPIGVPPMRVIPSPLIMVAVLDAISAGKLPRLERIKGLFRDTIHPNVLGAHLISLAHLVLMYGVDPWILTSSLGGLDVPDPATADWMK